MWFFRNQQPRQSTINRTGRSEAIFCACASLSSIPAGSLIKMGPTFAEDSKASALLVTFHHFLPVAFDCVGSVGIFYPQVRFFGHNFCLEWIFLLGYPLLYSLVTKSQSRANFPFSRAVVKTSVDNCSRVNWEPGLTRQSANAISTCLW